MKAFCDNVTSQRTQATKTSWSTASNYFWIKRRLAWNESSLLCRQRQAGQTDGNSRSIIPTQHSPSAFILPRLPGCAIVVCSLLSPDSHGCFMAHWPEQSGFQNFIAITIRILSTRWNQTQVYALVKPKTVDTAFCCCIHSTWFSPMFHSRSGPVPLMDGTKQFSRR